MSTSAQFLTVPTLTHRSSQHTRSDRARSAMHSRPTHNPATGHVASSSRVKLEDTPLGTPVPTPPSKSADSPRTSTSTSTSSSLPASQQPTPSLMASSQPTPSSDSSSSVQVQSPQQLSPRSLFRMVPLLLRLRSPPDLFNLSCSSGGPRTHAVLRAPSSSYYKLPQTLTYSKTLVCADAVNAEVLLRLARNDILDRAQQANRHVTALVDEE
jgi:hypothetical protein